MNKMYPYIKLSDLQNEHILTYGIYENYFDNYYITNDWSPEMYDALAFAGFIAVSVKDGFGNAFLLPEMQFSYAVLHWNNLHISKRMTDFIVKNVLSNSYYISINQDIEAVFDGIEHYHDDGNWMTEPYIRILKSLINSKQKYSVKIISVELWDNQKIIGGEIGYLTGSIYTSLTGFFDRKNYSNFGKIQLLSLALLLKKSGYALWNMGHPYMDYKFSLGAIEYKRQDFLKIWMEYREKKIESKISDNLFKCNELLKEII